MTKFRERAAGGLQTGDFFSVSRTFTDDDVMLFAKTSRDYNPVHFDVRFAEARKLSKPICHGLLTASLVTEIGGQIGWLASGMDFRFKGPVYVGETITCSLVISDIDKRGRAKASAKITKEDGVTVLEAEIRGIVPGPREREVLRQMLLEGDPTNGLSDGQQRLSSSSETQPDE